MGLFLMHGLLNAADAERGPISDNIPTHRLLRVNDLVAIVGDANRDLTDPTLPPEMIVDAALEHDAILTSYTAHWTVLPVRFGAAFSNEDAIRRHLEDPQQAEAATRQLAKLDGHQEFGLKVLIDVDPPSMTREPQIDSGRAFLRERAQVRSELRTLSERRAEFVKALTGSLAAVVSDARLKPARADVLGDFALLIARSTVEQFRQKVASFSQPAAGLGLSLRLNGPWPSYSFAVDAPEGVTCDA